MEMPGPVMRTLPLALALAGLSVSAAAPSHAAEVVVAYRSASCGCCKGWLDHLKKAGFTVQDNVVNNLTAIKQHYSVPTALGSCHTATINGDRPPMKPTPAKPTPTKLTPPRQTPIKPERS